MLYIDLALAILVIVNTLRTPTVFVDACGIVVTAGVAYLLSMALTVMGLPITAVVVFALGCGVALAGLLKRGRV